jgi:hypothetical protein
MMERQEWGAKPPKTAYRSHTPNTLVVHHTAGPVMRPGQAYPARVKATQYYHMYLRSKSTPPKQDFIDIGYHAVIDGVGVIYVGRPFDVVGAHVGGQNTNKIGVSLFGHFGDYKNGVAGEDVPPAALASLINVLTYLAYTYKIPTERIVGHKDLASTACPGDKLHALLPMIREEVRRRLESPTPPPPPTPAPGKPYVPVKEIKPTPAVPGPAPGHVFVAILVLLLYLITR